MDFQIETGSNEELISNCHQSVLVAEVADFIVLGQTTDHYRQTKKIWQPDQKQKASTKTKKQRKDNDNSQLLPPIISQGSLASRAEELAAIPPAEKSSDNSKSQLKIFDGTLGGLGYFDFMANLCQEKKINLDYFGCDLDQLVINQAQIKIQELPSSNTNLLTTLQVKPENLNQISQPKNPIPEPKLELSNKSWVKLTVKQANFLDYIDEFPNNFFDGIILDLGFSSNQLASGRRGFSYQKAEEVLDLRYDSAKGVPCWYKLAQIKSAPELGNIIYRFSGEKLAQKIAANLLTLIDNLKIETKQKHPQLSVEQVVDTVKASIPLIFRKKTNQILSRVWQALRIWTNDELAVLTDFLPKALEKLTVGGQLAIVSFHSLEDKIVTSFMRCMAAPVTDDFGNKTQSFELLTTKAVVAGPQELTDNPRSRSAMLRVFKKLI